MKRPLELLISIVHYNTPGILSRCLDALGAEGSGLNMHIVVVDNASHPPLDGAEISARPNVTLIRNTVNAGFGTANNQALRAWDAEAYLVLNPDVIVAPGTLGELLRRLRQSAEVGLIGPRLRFTDGGLQRSCRRLPTLRAVLIRGFLSQESASRFTAIRKYLMEDEVINAPTRVDWMLGSSLLIKRDALRRVGGFDERFFMYYEDVDLCHRINLAGWGVEYHPDVEWIHEYLRQSARPGQWKLRFAHFTSAMRFLLKHRSRRGWCATL
ncbi:MAG: glycosyltransferase family 2 protein [Elusimicrobiota bacterium]